MAALHSERNGAIAPTLLPFRRTEKRDGTELPEIAKLLGKVYDMHDGISAQLVVAGADMPKDALDASYALKWSDALTYTVIPTAAAGDTICGYTFPGRKDVLTGESFWLLVPTAGESRISVASFGAITAPEPLGGEAGGTSAAAILSALVGVTPLLALESAVGAGEVVIAAVEGLTRA